MKKLIKKYHYRKREEKKYLLLIIGGIIIILTTLFVVISNNYIIYPNAKITSEKETFTTHEPVKMIVDLKEAEPRTAFIQKAFANASSKPPLEIEIIAPDGRSIRSVPTEIKKTSTSQYEVTATPPNHILPGEYSLKVILSKNEKKRIIKKDFSWGVLAINFNKSIYKPGDKAYIQMGVLDNHGNTICNADLQLNVTKDNILIKTLSTKNNTISNSEECGPNNVTSTPDYFVNYTLDALGTYSFELTAHTANGEKTITENINVVENIPFEIERTGPTRIYPVNAFYPVTLSITANENFNGSVIEKVPLNFEIRAHPQLEKYSSISMRGQEKIISWNVNISKGQTVDLGYEFDAPDISPEFYLLGPLRLVDAHSGQALFMEARQWQIAGDAITNNGVIIYSDSTETNNLNFRTYAEATTVGGETSTIDLSDSSLIAQMDIVSAPTRDEKIAVVQQHNGIMNILSCTGGCDAIGDWTHIATQSAVTTDPNAELHRPWDIAYEQLSGLFTIVFGVSGDTGDVYYCQWDGTNWTPATECNDSGTRPAAFAPGAGNQIDMDASSVTGQPEWVRLVARGDRLTPYRKDEFLLGVSDSADDLFLAHWTGSAVNQASSPTAGAPTQLTASDARKFDIAWEETTGQGLAVLSDASVANLRYSVYDGSSWAAASTDGPANNGGQAYSHWIEMASDPISDDIAIGIEDSGSDFEAFMWTGAGFTEGTDDTSSENPTGKHMAVQWTRFSQRAIWSYADSNVLTSDMECWTSGGFVVVGDVGSSIGNADDVEDIVMTASPNSDRMLMTRNDQDDTLEGLTYSGATGCATDDWVNTSTSQLNTSVEGRPDLTVGTIPLAHSSTYAPYSAWSRNWKFYGDETSNDPSTGLNGAVENATPSGVLQEEVVRLRLQFAETGNIAQTDTRKFLQYTSGCNPQDEPNACTWTAVGDTGETSAVWRYATVGETCASCSDNTAVGTNGLTGSTQNGAYVADKDAAGGSNMDHSALAIAEYDYPLKAEDVTKGTTYYFRASDSAQQSPVFRKQDAASLTECVVGICTYPALTTVYPVVSGNVYNAVGTTTPWTGCSGTSNIAIRANGATYTGVCSAGDGSFSISITSGLPAGGNGVVMWIDGDATDGAAVTQYDGTDDSTGNILYANAVTVQSDDSSAVTNAMMDVYDSGNNGNIPYTVSTSNLTVNSGMEFVVYNSNTYTAGGTVATDATGGDFHIDDSATATIANATNAIGRDIIIDTGATLNINADTTVGGGDITATGTLNTTAGTPTVTMRGTGNISGAGTKTVHHLTVGDGTTAATTLTGTLTTNGNVSVGTGSTFNVNATLNISGGGFTTTTTGIVNTTSGTPTVTITGTGNVGAGAGGSFTLHNLAANGSQTLTSDIVLNSNLSVATGGSLALGSKNVTISGGGMTTAGTGTITCTACSAGTVTISGTGNIGGGGTVTAYNLAVNGSQTAQSTITANNTISVGSSGTFTLTGQNVNSASNFTTTTTGTITCAGASGTFTMTGGGSLGGGSGTITFCNLATTTTGTTVFTGAGTNTVNNNVSVGANTTLNLNSDILITGNLTNATNGAIGTSAGTPTVTVQGTSIGGGTTGAITFHNLTKSGGGTTTFSNGGTNTVNNNLSISAGTFTQSSTLSVTNDVSVATGSTLNTNAALNISGGDLSTTGTGVVNTTGGTTAVTISGTGNIGGGGTVTVYNLTVSGSQTLQSNTITSNNLNVETGDSLALNDKNFNSAADFATTGTGTITCSGCSTGTVTLSGTGNIGGGGTVTVYNLTSSGGTQTVSSATTILNDLTANATINGSSNVTVNGTVAGTGTISMSGGTFEQRVAAAENFGTTSTANPWIFATLLFSNSSGADRTITTQTGGSGTITASILLQLGKGSDSNATILDAGNRTWTLSGTNGTPFNIVSPSTSASLTANTSTFAYTGANGSGDTTIQEATYNNLTCNASDTFVIETNPLTVSGNLTVTSGTLSLSSNDLQVGSTSVTNSGGISVSGTLSQTTSGTTTVLSSSAGTATIGGSGTLTFYNLTFAPTVASGPTFTLGSGASETITISNILTVGNGSNGVTVTAASNNPIIDVNGSVLIQASGILTAPASSLFTIATDFTNNGTFNHSSGTVTFDTTTTSTFNGSGSPAITFSGFTSTTNTKTLTFTSGKTFQIEGLFTISGASGANLMNINSSSIGSQWFIKHLGSESVGYVRIQDSGCDGSTAVTVNGTGINLGNNGTCWEFAPALAEPRIKGPTRVKGNTRIK